TGILEPARSHRRKKQQHTNDHSRQSDSQTLHTVFVNKPERQRAPRTTLVSLRYRINETSGIVSISQSPDLFELSVVMSEMAREGSTYHVRVNASHPITHKPAAKVVVTGELSLADDDNRSLKLHATKNTDSEGYALLDFVLPPRFPQFPHTLQPDAGEVKLIGRRGALVAETEGQVMVDQFARTLITPDKPIYQPGQTMHVRALMFTPSRRALANQNVLIRILDPEDVTVF